MRPSRSALPRRPTSRPTSWVVAGSLASGVGAYLFQVLGARSLGDEGYAPISVLWTLQYLVLSVPLISIEAYLTRTVTLHPDDPRVLRRPLRVIALWLVLTAAVLYAVTYGLRDALFDGVGQLALVAAAIVLAYGGFVIVRGLLAGRNRFRSYGAATGLESVLRIIVAAPVVALMASPEALAWTLPVGPLAVVGWWLVDRRRLGSVEEGADDVEQSLPERAGAGRFLASTTTANACAQLLLAAGPLVLVPLGAGAREISVFFITVTAARAPLAFVLGGLLSRLLPPLTRLASEGRQRRLQRLSVAIAAGTVAVAAVGAGVAWLVGPELVALFFGSSFSPGRAFTTLTGFGVLLATGALVLNQVLIARGCDGRMLPPWLAGVVVAGVVIIRASGSPTMRVASGFVAGEVIALTGLLAAALTAPAVRAETRRPHSDPAPMETLTALGEP